MLTAAVPANDPLVAVAGRGQVTAHDARFGLRCDESAVGVTCLEGTVTVEVGQFRRVLSPNHRLVYDLEDVGEPTLIDAAVATAWRRGMLVFRQEPLSAVVAEINRYRPGNILISDEQLAGRRVDGTFYVAQLDQFFDQVRSAFGARVTRLPGGIVVIA